MDLKPFLPGATIHLKDSFYTLSDPFRAPLLALSGLLAPVGNIVDKLRVGILRLRVMTIDTDKIASTDVSTPLNVYLTNLGFSPSFISAFFRPFYQGIFLAPLQEQSAAMFSFVFKMFAVASASLPATGMAAISQQLAASLPTSLCHIRFNAPVLKIDSQQVTLHDADNSVVEAPVIIVATEGPEAARLLQDEHVVATSRGSICVYFTKQGPAPLKKPLLVLNGDEKDGPVNNMFFPSAVAPSYAPEGQTLISTSIIGDELCQSDKQLESAIRAQMTTWFGHDEVAQWNFLKTYRIPHSQTPQTPDFVFKRSSVVGDGIFVCGDHRNTPTVNGAMASGEAAARDALNYLSNPSHPA